MDAWSRWSSFGAQGLDWVNACGAARGEPGGEQRDSHEKQRGAEKDKRIVEAHAGTASSEKSGEAYCSAKTDDRPDQCQLYARSKNQFRDVADTRAQGKADGKL